MKLLKTPLLVLGLVVSLLSGSHSHAAISVYSIHDFGEGYTTGSSAPFTTADTSGNSRDALGTSSTGFSIVTDGARGNAFRVDGAASGLNYIQDSDLLAAVPDQNWGVGVYFRVTTSGQSSGTVMQLNGNSNGSPLINFEIDSSDVYRVSKSGDGNTFNYPSSFASQSGATVGEWDHLALINTGGNSIFYLNGTAIGNTYTGAIDLGQINLGLKAGGASQLSNGDFDYFKVVTFESGDSTASVLHALQVPEPTSALVGLLILPALLRRRRAA